MTALKLFILIAFVVVSCEKEDNENPGNNSPSGPEYELQINIEGGEEFTLAAENITVTGTFSAFR